MPDPIKPRDFRKDIAPAELIRKDFELIRSHEKLIASNDVADMIFVQSIEGRAHNGAGVFNKRAYVNTNIDDIVRALKRDPVKTKAYRQGLIDEIADFVKTTMHGEKRDRLVNHKGEPFLGIDLFRERRVNARDVLRGIFLGGLRDNIDVRKETEARYQIKIGGGKLYFVNANVMSSMNMDGEHLAHDPHEHEIEEFRRQGLIMDDYDPEMGDLVRYFYIRHRVGPGQSDDAAIVIAGILYNMDVALGVFLADAIDTLEKYATEFKDQDQELAYYIGRGYKELKLTMDDAYEMCFLSSIPEAEEDLVPDSSLRYLLTTENAYKTSALESHLAFAEGKPVPPIPVGYKQVPNTQLYTYIKRRLMNVRRLDALSVPELMIQEWDRPIRDIVKKNFIVLEDEQQLATAIRRFKESKSEIIIVVNKNGKITGTLTATDLIALADGSHRAF
jgi:hypothetical protein